MAFTAACFSLKDASKSVWASVRIHSATNAVKAMKFYGRQSAERAQQMLGGFDDFPEFMQTPEGQEIYNDLKFEFEYCR